MNIVFFARHFYPHIGGVEKHVLKVSEILTQKGHEVTVITEKFDSKLKEKETFKSIKIFRIPITTSEKQKKYEIWSYLKINSRIIKEADVIHAHDVFFWYLPFRILYPRKKVFVTFHGYEGNDLPTRKAVVSHKIAEVLCKGNICVGDYLKKWYGTSPDLVTYGAIDKQKKMTLGVKHKKNAILYIGRLEKEAGIMDYLRLLRKLKDENINAKLTVLGDGKLMAQARQYSRKHKLEVVFKGFVKNSESFLSGFDTVFTSRYLGTLEAMSFQKPVFCIYNNDIKKDCFVMSPFKNFIYHSDNVDNLAEMFLQSLKNTKDKQKKVNKGYNWVRHQSWEKLAGQYLRLWKKR